MVETVQETPFCFMNSLLKYIKINKNPREFSLTKEKETFTIKLLSNSFLELIANIRRSESKDEESKKNAECVACIVYAAEHDGCFRRRSVGRAVRSLSGQPQS